MDNGGDQFIRSLSAMIVLGAATILVIYGLGTPAGQHLLVLLAQAKNP